LNTQRLNNTLLNDQWAIKKIREDIKMFPEANENENTTYQNLWDTAKAVVKGKFIATSSYLIKTKQNRDISNKQPNDFRF
jgi:hypothetical protein